MSLLTEADLPRKHRAPVALAILFVVVLPLLGLFAWSWFQPVALHIGGQGLVFGYGPWAQPIYLIDARYPTRLRKLEDDMPGPKTLRPHSGHINVSLPFTTETYWFWWY